ncbi:MAG: alpha/beta hydrolase [bacterium]|nr:alpha/beta hydrolase [bacterium]
MDNKAGLHPSLRSFLAQASSDADQLVDPLDPGPSRRALERELADLDTEGPDVWRVSDTLLDTGRRVRVYEPQPGTRRPALVFFHGGGYVRCSIDTHDSMCRLLSLKAGVVVVSVDYRLAPEAKFPEPLEDCHGAAASVHARARDFGIDPERMAVGGDSAGGNLTAGVIRLARQRGGPEFRHQLLIYPHVDMRADTRSMCLYSKGFFLDLMEFYVACYTRDETDFDDPLCSPLRAGDLAGQPPATVVVCGFDPLRDEGRAYARKLADAGVTVELIEHADMLHGFLLLRSIVGEEVDRAFAEYGRALARALAVASS